MCIGTVPRGARGRSSSRRSPHEPHHALAVARHQVEPIEYRAERARAERDTVTLVALELQREQLLDVVKAELTKGKVR